MTHRGGCGSKSKYYFLFIKKHERNYFIMKLRKAGEFYG